MKPLALCLLVSCVVSTAALAGSWSDLWRTPEQQGQQLLDSNQAAAAARLLKDPQRRGYAELRAGDYAQAAKSLAPLRDVDSLYNRGNALAHTGQLQEALAAYDAALVQSPGNRDVVRNRDLVARALDQQRKQSGGNQQKGSGDGKQNAASAGQGSDGSGQSGSRNTPNSQSQASANAQSQSGSQGQNQAGSQAQNQGGAQSASAGQPGARDSAQAQGRTPAGTSNSQAESPATSRSQQGTESESRVAEASAATTNSAANGKASTALRGNPPPENDPVTVKSGSRTVGTSQPSRPLSEQSLALDQWLRGIPDDSAELLRRKFLIEHMMKEQGNGP